MSNYYYTIYNGKLLYKKRNNAKWRYVETDQVVIFDKQADES